MIPANDDALFIEERKLALEEKKLEIEREKIKVERFKAWATGGSIVISLLVAGLTIAFGIWSHHKQAMTQIELQDRQAKSQFEIKAAEIVMNTDEPGVTHNKAKALLALFPGKLPGNFAESFNEANYLADPEGDRYMESPPTHIRLYTQKPQKQH